MDLRVSVVKCGLLIIFFEKNNLSQPSTLIRNIILNWIIHLDG